MQVASTTLPTFTAPSSLMGTLVPSCLARLLPQSHSGCPGPQLLLKSSQPYLWFQMPSHLTAHVTHPGFHPGFQCVVIPKA